MWKRIISRGMKFTYALNERKFNKYFLSLSSKKQITRFNVMEHVKKRFLTLFLLNIMYAFCVETSQ